MTGRGPILTRLLVAAAVCLALAPVQDRPRFGGAVELHLGRDVAVADPAVLRSPAELQLASLLFPRLIEFDSDGRRVAALLSRWEVSADGLTVRLRLHDSDHSGVQRITSGDLAVSLQRLLRDTPQSPAALVLRSISGSERFLADEIDWLPGLTVTDDRTLEIHLDHRQPLLLDALADVQTSPVRTVTEPDTVLADLGAFQPDPGRSGLLVDNIAFSGGRPYLDYVLTRRDARYPADIRQDDIVPLDPYKSGEAGGTSVVYPGARCVYIVFHPAGAVSDPARRAAVLSSIDAGAMARIFFGNSGSRLTTLVPPSAVPSELIGAAVPEGGAESAGARTLRIAYPAGSAVLRLVAERIKVDLLVKGVDARLIEYREEDLPPCDLFLFDALISDHAPEYSLWCALVRLGRLAGRGVDPPQGDSLSWLRELTQSSIESLDFVPLLQLRHSVAFDPRLRGVRFRFDGTLDLENAWIAPPGEQR